MSSCQKLGNIGGEEELQKVLSLLTQKTKVNADVLHIRPLAAALLHSNLQGSKVSFTLFQFDFCFFYFFLVLHILLNISFI